jgi:alpha,alpha-trehalase
MSTQDLDTLENTKLIEKISSALVVKKHIVKRKASGFLRYDYLVPSGFYKEQWDWDAFFMGVALAAELSSEAIYLRNWCLNFFSVADEQGYAPGCATPQGPEKGTRAFSMKPFIGQGAYISSKFLGDFAWLKPHYDTLKKMVLYRENHLWCKDVDLPVWTNWMESGADNNPSILDYPLKSIVGCDVSTFVYRDYLAFSSIAEALNKQSDAEHFKNRAATLKENMLKSLWDEKDATFYNYNSNDNSLIKHHTYSNLVPLWESIAPQNFGKEMIERYLLNSKCFWSKYGVRTLSAEDKLYNQENIITPYSNWQGPVWPICNYLHMHALLNYGYQAEAIDLSRKITLLCLHDFAKTGGMHENYNADTGEPLAAPDFISWNLLVGNMLSEAINKKNPFVISSYSDTVEMSAN